MQKTHQLFSSLVLGASLAMPAAMAADGATSAREAKPEQKVNESHAVSDAYIKGRLVTAYTLSTHLNPFKLDVAVNNGKVALSGSVDNATERDLAVEIAQGVEGVTAVSQTIKLDPTISRVKKEADTFGQRFDDATTTARVKSQLLWNGNTSGLAINVDTSNSVVTLSGKVASTSERALAAQITENTKGVVKVDNQLTVGE